MSDSAGATRHFTMLLCLGLPQMRLFMISYVWDEVKAPEQSSHEIADEIFRSTRVYAGFDVGAVIDTTNLKSERTVRDRKRQFVKLPSPSVTSQAAVQ